MKKREAKLLQSRRRRKRSSLPLLLLLFRPPGRLLPPEGSAAEGGASSGARRRPFVEMTWGRLRGGRRGQKRPPEKDKSDFFSESFFFSLPELGLCLRSAALVCPFHSRWAPAAVPARSAHLAGPSTSRGTTRRRLRRRRQRRGRHRICQSRLSMMPPLIRRRRHHHLPTRPNTPCLPAPRCPCLQKMRRLPGSWPKCWTRQR